jgi:Skp family chaperone for outer membrane proteins
MKKIIYQSILFTALSSLAFAANTDSVSRTKQLIDEAAQDLSKTLDQYSDMRRFTYNEINKLDDEVIALAKELRALERDEELRGIKEKTLDKENEQRKTQFS